MFSLPISQVNITSHVPSRDFFFKNIFKRFYLFIFRQKGRQGERKGEKHQCVVASHALPTGDLATQACALTGNWTSDPLVLRLALNPLSHTSQGSKPLLTRSVGHSTFSIHCMNLFFVCFSCIFTFLEIIKHNMAKNVAYFSIFNIKMATQKITNFDKFLKNAC